MDYPLMERIYYSLVAGFDVFGDLGHQLGDRLYMDELRIEGESYFLDFLPSDQRENIMQGWYKKALFNLVGYYPTVMPARIDFQTENPKREFIEGLVTRYINKKTGIAFDPYNYMDKNDTYPALPRKYRTIKDYLRGFRAVSVPGMGFLKYINDYNANVAFIRIRIPDGNDRVISAVVHRWHDNVQFLVGEDLRLDSSKDRADFFPGFIGSYPNYFFDVNLIDLPDFLSLLYSYKGRPKDRQKLVKYGINRADADFWQEYDWFQQRFNEEEPTRAGLFDLNRYYYKALSVSDKIHEGFGEETITEKERGR